MNKILKIIERYLKRYHNSFRQFVFIYANSDETKIKEKES